MSIDSIFWIIALSAFLVVVYVLFSMPQADAITRAEYEELKIQEDQARENLKIMKQLSDQRELIKENNAKLSTLKEELKDVNGLSDWESLRLKAEYEQSCTGC
jgi:cell shape-determining protein MreC